MPYSCKQCKKVFSLKTDSLMYRSPLGLKQWVHLIHVWTGGEGPSATDEMERRSGRADGTGDDVNARLLTAATEDVAQLERTACSGGSSWARAEASEPTLSY